MQPARKRRSGPGTRERLLDLAYGIVKDEGLESLTIRELAQRGQVAVGLPHAHFGSRDGLLDELRRRAWDEFDRVMDVVVESKTVPGVPVDFEAVIRGCVAAIVDFAAREPNLFELLVVSPSTQVSQALLEREMQTARRFVDFLLEGEKQGRFAFASDPFVFAVALWTSIQGFVQRSSAGMLPATRKYLGRVLDELLEVFFSRIRVPADLRS